MRICVAQRGNWFRRQSGLTLVEMLVASTLLLLILLGLMLMFNQTQRAFRTGLRQNDTLETGRAAMDLIARDIEQMAAAYRWDITNAQVQLHSITLAPVVYDPPGGQPQTNHLQTFFFLKNQATWEGVGYRVLNSAINTARLNETNNILVGALYCYRTNSSQLSSLHLSTFHGPTLHMVTNGTMRRLADGVVHFSVKMYDKNGLPFTNSFPPEIHVDNPVHDLHRVNLSGSLVPASLDLELGILEPQAMDQLRPLIALNPNENAVRNYLTNNAGKIHIFRRQIPIRTAVR